VVKFSITNLERVARKFEAFGIVVEPELYAGKYFITHRKVGDRTRYTIRQIDEDGSTSVFGNVNGFSTRWGAERWLVGRRW